MSLKVMHVITRLSVGDAQKRLLALTTQMDPRRYKPVIVSLDDGDKLLDFERAGISVYDLRVRGALDIGSLWQLGQIINQERPAILHTHLSTADAVGRLMGRLHRIRLVISSLHPAQVDAETFFGQIAATPWLDRWMPARWCRAYAVASQAAKQDVVRSGHVSPDSVTVLPDGIVPPEAISADKRAALRQELRLAQDAPLVGMLGPLQADKGHRVLLASLRQLAAQWPTLHCAILGDGKSRTLLEAYAQELGIKNRVTFLGLRHDVSAWMAAFDVFALPSLSELAPVSVLEAMALGCPIVATAVGAIPEWITHEDTGLLVARGDAAALARAIDRLLIDRSFARRLGYIARYRFLETFDGRYAAQETASWYDRLLGKSAASDSDRLESAPDRVGAPLGEPIEATATVS